MPLPSHPLCPLCGVPFSGAGDDHPCSSCLKSPPHFHAARAALVHEGPGRDLVHALKYSGRTHLRRPLALLIVEQLTGFVAAHRPDLIVPVPLHVRRLRSRGYNQALLVGELLAREWRIPLRRQALKRLRWTEPQIRLAAELRRENVRNAFGVPDAAQVSGKRVLLVDDVFTTGSTVDEGSRVLVKAGAEQVLVVTATRALG
jgi:ComF family protein